MCSNYNLSCSVAHACFACSAKQQEVHWRICSKQTNKNWFSYDAVAPISFVLCFEQQFELTRISLSLLVSVHVSHNSDWVCVLKKHASYTLPCVTKQHRKTDDLSVVVHRDLCCFTCVRVWWCTCWSTHVCLCTHVCAWLDQEAHSGTKPALIAVFWRRMCCTCILHEYPSCTSEHENTFRHVFDCPTTWTDCFATATLELHCLFCGPLFLIHLLGQIGRATKNEENVATLPGTFHAGLMLHLLTLRCGKV